MTHLWKEAQRTPRWASAGVMVVSTIAVIRQVGVLWGLSVPVAGVAAGFAVRVWILHRRARDSDSKSPSRQFCADRRTRQR